MISAQTPPKIAQSLQIKKRSQSQRRLIKLEKRGFEIEAEKLRSQYNNKYMLNEIKLKSKSTKKLLTEIEPQNIGNFLKPTKIISVTAHKWVLYDYFSSKYIRGYRARDSHELSVFSKLLVFCAVNTIVEKYAIDAGRFETIVTDGVLKLHRGSCLLRVDDIVSLEDLLYLMLMEESEVYETILAVNVGAFLQRKRQKEYYSVFDTKDKFMKEHLKNFYELVNSYCQLLKLENIRYIEADPELRRDKNRGSAADIGVISIQCLKIPLFMGILKTIEHSVTVKYINLQGNLAHRTVTVQSRSVANKYIPYSNVCRNWQQDNFMNSHCSIFYQKNSGQCSRPIVVVLLGCYGPGDREKDIQQITEWYIKSGKNGFDDEGEKDKGKEGVLQPKKSGVKLASIPERTGGDVQRRVEQKLRTQSDQEISKKYDEAIRFKVNSRSIRTKTQVK